MLNPEHLIMMVFYLYNILEFSFKFICKLAFTLCLKLRNPWNILRGTFNVCTKCYSQKFKCTYSYCIWSLPRFLPQYRIHLLLGYIPEHGHREYPHSLKILYTSHPHSIRKQYKRWHPYLIGHLFRPLLASVIYECPIFGILGSIKQRYHKNPSWIDDYIYYIFLNLSSNILWLSILLSDLNNIFLEKLLIFPIII